MASQGKEFQQYFERIETAIKEYHPAPDMQLIEKAFQFAREKHDGQLRSSGEPYFYHLAEAALNACRLKLGHNTVAAALLHDVMEDCDVSYEELAKEFSPDIAAIVDGVTRLEKIEFSSKEEEQAESFRKLIVAMAKDIRAVLVKLCDRLHNMQTLEFRPREKQVKKAREVLDIYAPLANRLGIDWLRCELQDLSLKYMRPEVYQEIHDGLERTYKERKEYIQLITKEIGEVLQKAGIEVSVYGRVKHIYSIWLKMNRKSLAFEEVHDLFGIRVIMQNVAECYQALGLLHGHWNPVPSGFKDYIGNPKVNMYQSLHTLLIGPGGKRVEVQIRTEEMHRVAEDGVAAYWKYKGDQASRKTSFNLTWVKKLVEEQQYAHNPDEFMQSVQAELFPEEVFLFTPEGDIIHLPAGATPIDFAYAIHSDIGHHASGARVNEQTVPLSYKLHNGDTVEISTSKSQSPSKKWLEHVRTSRARQRIRSYLKTEEQTRSREVGQGILERELKKYNVSLKKFEKEGKILKLAKKRGAQSEGEMYAQIGYGKASLNSVLKGLLPENFDESAKPIDSDEGEIRKLAKKFLNKKTDKTGVLVGGIDDVLVRFARCCDPLPGDRIVGFITRGRGVTVHHAQCRQALRSDPLRKIEVNWDSEKQESRQIHISVRLQNQTGLLARVTQVLAEQGSDVARADVHTSKNGARIDFEIIVDNSRHFADIKRAIESIHGVFEVERVYSEMK